MKDKKSEIEAKFAEVKEQAEKEIREQLYIANEAISKAEKISEKYGIPFYAACSPLGQQYFPESFDEKWEKSILSLNSDDNDDDENNDYRIINNFLEEFDLYRNNYGAGWEHSAVC